MVIVDIANQFETDLFWLRRANYGNSFLLKPITGLDVPNNALFSLKSSRACFECYHFEQVFRFFEVDQYFEYSDIFKHAVCFEVGSCISKPFLFEILAPKCGFEAGINVLFPPEIIDVERDSLFSHVLVLNDLRDVSPHTKVI